jgi:hypothetical protein
MQRQTMLQLALAVTGLWQCLEAHQLGAHGLHGTNQPGSTTIGYLLAGWLLSKIQNFLISHNHNPYTTTDGQTGEPPPIPQLPEITGAFEFEVTARWDDLSRKSWQTVFEYSNVDTSENAVWFGQGTKISNGLHY